MLFFFFSPHPQLECTGTEYMACCQAMDNSHVSLVSVSLRADGFDKFRCEEY